MRIRQLTKNENRLLSYIGGENMLKVITGEAEKKNHVMMIRSVPDLRRLSLRQKTNYGKLVIIAQGRKEDIQQN